MQCSKSIFSCKKKKEYVSEQKESNETEATKNIKEDRASPEDVTF